MDVDNASVLTQRKRLGSVVVSKVLFSCAVFPATLVETVECSQLAHQNRAPHHSCLEASWDYATMTTKKDVFMFRNLVLWSTSTSNQRCLKYNAPFLGEM